MSHADRPIRFDRQLPPFVEAGAHRSRTGLDPGTPEVVQEGGHDPGGDDQDHADRDDKLDERVAGLGGLPSGLRRTAASKHGGRLGSPKGTKDAWDRPGTPAWEQPGGARTARNDQEQTL